MPEIISNNPWWTIAIVWAAFILVIIVAGIYRARMRNREEDSRDDGQLTLALGVEDRVTPQLERVRIHMRNRFMPPVVATGREMALVDQIVHDQAVAHEKPGAVVTDPEITPEATTYYHLRESVERFTYIIGKEGFMSISEATPDGAETPVYAIPQEWAEPMSILVLEVARLRSLVGHPTWPEDADFALGEFVTTPRAPFWRGTVCGWYRNSEGRLGFNVEAEAIPLAIHNYPSSGLRR